ncbi:protein LLP homolog [Hylaeus volcanicus]|uniref:protein LLP homolog n=1 Tax=Hylaeus volcanicus TaxID=313075 RepID=UPI0023B7FCAF|nr:protein LLP homolog [Hylaeus volcanicus]XP_053975814.1 protein LLP homolog [Hylaeus volcanicus]
MAKSLRSKWKRKCRAIKRERYGAKELERLKKTLCIDEYGSQDAEMAEISEIATVVDAKTIRENEKAKKTETDGQKMDVESSNVRVYNKKTLKDQYGNYPIWMSLRKIVKHKKGRAKAEKASLKSHKRLTRKQKKKAKRN